MYIAKIDIKNYRPFEDVEIRFSKGLTVIIGENNSGKTALLEALSFALQRSGRKSPTIDDFHQGIEPSNNPPEIKVKVLIRSDAEDTETDRAVVATWLTKTEAPWEATLTYRFFLPEREHEEFAEAVEGDRKFRKVLEEFLPKYVSRIYGGKEETLLRAEPDFLRKFDLKILGALRDAESELLSGSNPLLRDMLLQVLDTQDVAETPEKEFRESADKLIGNIKGRLNQEELFKLIEATGASESGQLELSGELSERDLMNALQLVVRASGFEIPLTHNGLGYNNLIYIALVLASLDSELQERAGENALAFPCLAIEEPEAHLHPSMQYKLLKYLRNRIRGEETTRQLFVTTHSSHITAAADLDSIMCLSISEDDERIVSYPGRLFEDEKSKKYVERYLDATKSSMLFAKAVLLVEGLAELLVLPVLAQRYCGFSIEDSHVAVIAVGGSTFKHFLPLFGGGTKKGEEPLPRRVACVVDADPARKEKNVKGARWKGCAPFMLKCDTDNYHYRQRSDVVRNLEKQAEPSNIRIFSGTYTFEYDLALENPGCETLLTEGTSDELADWPSFWEGYDLAEDIGEAVRAPADEEEAERRAFAKLYLDSIDSKGAHALALSKELLETSNEKVIRVPDYISDAIEWVCDGDD